MTCARADRLEEWRAAARPRRVLAAAAVSAFALAACGGGSSSSAAATSSASSDASSTPSATSASPSPTPAATPAAASPTVGQQGDWVSTLHAKPAAIPLRFQAPTIGVDIPLEAVGLTSKNAMDAPEGPPNDAVWKTGFWYRGGVEPGQPGVATIAGHLDDTLGRAAAFWNLRRLHAGDVVQVADQRTGAVIRFRVTEADVYSLAQSGTRAVLDRMFGAQSVVEQKPVFPADGISRLTLITCSGTFTRGEYDHRYVVYAERIDGPGSAATPATPPPAA